MQLPILSLFDFIGIKFEDYIIGDANKSDEITQDLKAVSVAEQLRETLQKYL
ncbi:hypothetical protein [Pseudogracilibacillus sp. SO30301A]|uniref:hypothetical protein n=1 Tax=Pseudogracilibacillus sp. SO30301A TaxID=3098291 RepID=UPI00300E092B